MVGAFPSLEQPAGAQRRQAACDVRGHRAGRDAQNVSHSIDRQVLVEPQHQHRRWRCANPSSAAVSAVRSMTCEATSTAIERSVF